MDRKEKLEGEEIQKGLEQFLEQELYGSAGKVQTRPKTDELDLSLAKPSYEQPPNRRQPVEKEADGPDLSLARPVERRTEGKSASRQSAGKSTESNRKEMAQRRKQEPAKTKKQETGKQKKKKQEKGKKKKNRFFKVLAVLAVLFIIGFIGLYTIVGSLYNKMTYKEADSFTFEPMKEDGVINVLLIGNDSRLAGDDGRSDAMILVSISDKTKTITMTSLLRDMYVEIPGHDGNRLNAAYSYGGPELLMQTIEQNFDIPVHRYALVNFQAFANLVDAVGGVDLELTNDEVQYVNGYLMEYNQLEGRDLATDFLDPSLSGMIHLNGPQALAFTRNRYIGTDFGRTERQRKVLSAVIAKLPGSVLTNGGELADGLFPNLTTNLKQGECFSLSLNAWKFLSYDMVQQCVPIEGSYSNATIRDMAVLEVDFEANKQFLKSTLYGE